MASHSEAETALETLLFAVAGLPAGDQRAKGNNAFDATVGTPWIRTIYEAFEPKRLTMPAVGGWYQTDGTLRVFLNLPLDTDDTAVKDLTQEILNAFRPELDLFAGDTHVRIAGSRSWPGEPGIETKHDFTVPVEIRWSVLSINPLT